MTVKELKDILKDADDNCDILILDRTGLGKKNIPVFAGNEVSVLNIIKKVIITDGESK